MEPHGHGFYTGFQMGDCGALLVKLLMLIGVSVHIRYGGYHKWSYRQEHPPLQNDVSDKELHFRPKF